MVKAKTNKTTKKSQAFAVGTHEGQVFASVPYTQEDLKNALLIVSLTINAAFLILYILTQIDSSYTYQIALSLLGN